MKLYTSTGDDGTTGLFGGDRVSKDDVRIDAYGAVDELNASLGLALVACDHEVLQRNLAPVQSRLFDLGADLATPIDSRKSDVVARMNAEHVKVLEQAIDEVDALNDDITTFVMPGGSELAARLHLCRCICRRAERETVRLGHRDQITPEAIIFLNRLSDLLFASSRLANKLNGLPDVPWISGSG
ncbi:MAG: cob(I)yrinic acid a,c-diamide adenosyltransferase [Planctomycetota bacterium]|nr:cob(I)yrinic acid a,c-diamide adenosyltransferase [Planctomycetota bacterium]MEC8818583.1 cob(I)yrinic acid a,c-diamide adenosyltransferase [Planctomycetota bacterium]MEC9157447.1 cob(I)yrinic acid a,c-diamide adenosyltransferase [Planctomycetota bacterium]MEC9232749.1 cob(I)yrinic acid a,c-diamide adenosyltransferase [Planctomycetota bacterium]MED5506261.1 cob(I)yrinic acid a,c-diamide adenosyltransferase [Planctomycetota bacterium]